MDKRPVGCGFVERTVNAFGTRIIVRIARGRRAPDNLAETMMARLSEAWRDSPEPPSLADKQLPVVELGEVTEVNFEQIHSLMSSQVTLAALKFHAGSTIMLHAGGVARADGSVAAIIGPSGRGKTTTTRNLGKYFGYVSDETIAITFTGEILPYRKPLSVVTEGHIHKLQIAPSDLGLLPLPENRLFLGSLVLLERAKNGESASKVSKVGFARGVATAIEQSSYLLDLEQPLATFCAAASSVGGFKLLTVGDQSRVHEVADRLFSNEPAPSWVRVMPVIADAASATAAYLPADIIDAVECEDGTVVFTGSREAILLDGLGPQLWRAACYAESWSQLIERIEHHHGQAPTGDSKTAIQSIAVDLINSGVLRHPTRAEGSAASD